MTETRYVGVAPEPNYGEIVAETKYDFQVASAGLDVPDDPNIVLPTLERFDQAHIGGYYTPEGPLELPVDIITIGFFLKHALGGYKFTAGVGDDPNTHEFWANPEFELPSFNTRVGKDKFEHLFLGCVANTLSISVENELAMANIGVIAQRDKPAPLRTGESLNKLDPDLYPLAFYNTKCEVDNEDLSSLIKSWSMEFNNGVNADEGQGLGSRYSYGHKPNKGELNLTINVFDDDKEYLAEYWGNPDGPEDSVLQDEEGVDVQVPFPVLTTFESGDFGEMEILKPKCTFKKVPTAITGGDPRRPDLSIRCESDEVNLVDDVTVVKTPIYVKLLNFEDTFELSPTPP